MDLMDMQKTAAEIEVKKAEDDIARRDEILSIRSAVLTCGKTI
jgi:hypothetical protein